MKNFIEDKYHADLVQRSIPFEIISFRALYNRHKNNLRDLTDCHRIQFNALFIITTGESIHSIDCQSFPLRRGTIIPLVKGQVHHFEKELKVDGMIITFTDQFITDSIAERDLFHFLQLYHSPTFSCNEKDIQHITILTDLLFKEQESSNHYLEVDSLRSIFLALGIQLRRIMPKQDSSKTSQRFMDFTYFKQALKNNYKETHNANDYAQKLNLSYKYLNAICKENSGLTAKAFIDNWVVLEIKRNIAENVDTIKEIAYNTGFDEPTNLIRFFKKHTRLTPKEYRTSLENKTKD